MLALIGQARRNAAVIFAALISWTSTSHALSEYECSCLEQILRLSAHAPESLVRESERLFDDLCADVAEFEIFDSISSSMVAEMACEALLEPPEEWESDFSESSAPHAALSLVLSGIWTFQQRQLGGQIEWRNNGWFDASLKLEFRRRRASLSSLWSSQ